METKTKTDFEKLVELEPRLGDLLKKAQTMPLTEDIILVWYRQLKPLMKHLVGFMAEKQIPELTDTEAYECAYETLYSALEIRKGEVSCYQYHTRQ